MRSIIFRYVGLISASLVLFINFIACGSQMYQVSLDDDVDAPGDNVVSNETDPNAQAFGIHSISGWTKLPIKFKIGSELSKDQLSYLEDAMKTWEWAVGRPKQLFQFVGNDSQTGDSFPDLYSSLKDSINGHYFDFNWGKTQKPDQVLATTIWENNPEKTTAIDKADIRFNGERYLIGDSLSLTATKDKEVVDMQSLALHELGHLLGLTHMGPEHDSNSIMNPNLFIGEGLISRSLSRGDIERIQKIYGCEGEACEIDKLMAKAEFAAVKKTETAQQQTSPAGEVTAH